MIHLAVIGEASAVLGSAWLLRRFTLFRFGEDSGCVAEMLRQARLEALRGRPRRQPAPPTALEPPPE
jgi:hypothetical protein